MSMPYRTRHRFAAAVATACVGLALASAAEAVDLRDWGRKFSASERFVVLSQFGNQAVLDKETQLVWQAVVEPTTAIGTWAQAHIGCQNAITGGRRGWRLPTYPELTSLAGTDGSMPAVFDGIPDSYYWTATDYPGSAGYARVFYVPTGSNAGGITKSAQQRFWCVRGPA